MKKGAFFLGPDRARIMPGARAEGTSGFMPQYTAVSIARTAARSSATSSERSRQSTPKTQIQPTSSLALAGRGSGGNGSTHLPRFSGFLIC